MFVEGCAFITLPVYINFYFELVLKQIYWYFSTATCFYELNILPCLFLNFFADAFLMYTYTNIKRDLVESSVINLIRLRYFLSRSSYTSNFSLANINKCSLLLLQKPDCLLIFFVVYT